MPDPTPAAFVSYSREDSEFALRLAKDLKAAGAAVWLDQLDIRPGHPWDNAIEQALEDASQMLVVLSPSSARSPSVRDEISFALEAGKIVVPVLYMDCVVPLRLQRAQRIDFRADYTRGLASLLDQLRIADPDEAILKQAAQEEAGRHAAWQAREAEAQRLHDLESPREIQQMPDRSLRNDAEVLPEQSATRTAQPEQQETQRENVQHDAANDLPSEAENDPPSEEVDYLTQYAAERRRKIRSVFAILAGLLSMPLLFFGWNVTLGHKIADTEGLATSQWFDFVVGLGIAFFGGWLAGRIAGYKRLTHGVVLAVIMFAIFTAILVQASSSEDHLPVITFVIDIAGPGAVIAGAALARRRAARS